MDASFDNAALVYDKTFTDSAIGKLQREQVYVHLRHILEQNKIASVLEINCGTGEDAIWLASKNLKVTATDISEKMLEVAKGKQHGQHIAFEQADINNIADEFSGSAFDMIFSNFGGLNCLNPNEFEAFFKNAYSLLSKGGKLVLVIMPKNTIWEKLYFLSKGDFKNAFRRTNQKLQVDVNGQKVTTYYYDPKDTVNFASAFFNLKQISPIGFFVPPSYLETYFKAKGKLLSITGKLDKAIYKTSFLSKYSDHYLIVLEKK